MIQKQKKPSSLGRIPARELEQVVSSRIQRLLASPQELAASCLESNELENELGRVIEAAQAMAEKWSELTSQQSAELVRSVVRRIVLRGSELEIEVDVEALAAGLLHKEWNACNEENRSQSRGRHLLTVKCSFALARRRGELRLVLPGFSTGSSQSASPLLKAIVMAQGWKERIVAGQIYSVQQLATEAKLNSRYAARIFQLEKAKEFITQLRTEAESNPRLCVMQLFGSDSGFVVSHAAVASGAVDPALIPEVPFSMAKVSEYITDKLKAMKENPNHRRSPHGLVLMAETAIPTDVLKYIDEDDKLPNDEKILRLEREEREEIARYLANDRRVRGQTPDALRTGGLKIVSRVLQNEIKNLQEFPGDYWSDFRVFTNEPRHLLRSLEPSSSDIIFGHRLGCLAVDNAMAGFTDFMVSQWLTEFVLVPLRLVALGRKRVPRDGIFWRSVLDSTGQPAKLTDDSETA